MGRMKEHFCTYFDHRFLPQGLALLRSLRKHHNNFVLWVLCLDEPCLRALTLLEAPEVRPVALASLESADPGLREAKNNRSTIEYYFTCSPAWPLYLLNAHAEIRRITYLDADLFFFFDPRAILDSTSEASIAIVPHRFASRKRQRERFGSYNVGWISFRNDERARQCLRRWRQQCLQWCYDRAELGRFADQKYLDEWPKRFERVQVIDHIGANLAPWNLGNYQIKETPEAVMVDDKPLIFFHFHGLKKIRPWLHDARLASYGLSLSGAVRRAIYAPYLRELNATEAEASELLNGAAESRHPEPPARYQTHEKNLLFGLKKKARSFLILSRAVLYRDFIFTATRRTILKERLRWPSGR